MAKKNIFSAKKCIPIFVAVVVLVLLCVGTVIDSNEFSSHNPQTATKPYIELPLLDEKQVLVSDIVAEWLKGETKGKELYEKYSAVGRVYSAKSVTIQYSIHDIPAGIEVKRQVVELSENKAFENSKKIDLPGTDRKIRFDYLFTNRTYYYRVTAYLSDGSKIDSRGQFETADTPRIISGECMWNMRDIGGVQTLDGKRIKQGLVYRGVELDGAVYEKFYITEASAKVMTDQLGIKSEIDLRAPNDRIKDMLGPGINHTIYGTYAYVDSLVPNYWESYRQLFSDLSQKENYPVYIHCTYGKDRTGTVCYLLQLLLGVSEEDAFKEWEISVLLDGKIDYTSMEDYIEELKKFDGDTMQEKAENFLLSCGVKQQEIDNIREILLED